MVWPFHAVILLSACYVCSLGWLWLFGMASFSFTVGWFLWPHPFLGQHSVAVVCLYSTQQPNLHGYYGCTLLSQVMNAVCVCVWGCMTIIWQYPWWDLEYANRVSEELQKNFATYLWSLPTCSEASWVVLNLGPSRPSERRDPHWPKWHHLKSLNVMMIMWTEPAWLLLSVSAKYEENKTPKRHQKLGFV